MPRRILFIIDSLARTGTGRQLLLVSQTLAQGGWDLHVAAFSGPSSRPDGDLQSEFAAAKIPVTYMGRRWPIDPISVVRLARHVARLRPDIIHTWNCTPGLAVALAFKKQGLPRIIAGQYRIDARAPSWEWFLLRKLAARIDCFVTNSSTVRDWCLTHKLPAEKFTIIPSGVPSFPSPVPRGGARGGAIGGAAVPTRDELLHELHLPADAKLIGVIGRLIPEKRVKDLIWAADLLRVLHDNLRVLIIGDGPLRQQLERYARLASDLEHIRFLGERPDVGRILPHLDVLWNGSDNTGLSIAILEAMAAGVPVVASDTPSNRELVIEGETGYLIPLGTRAGRAARARATDRIFSDTGLATRLGTAAATRVGSHFADEDCIAKYATIYEHLAG